MQVKLQGFCQVFFYRGRAQAQFPSFCRHCRNVLLFEVPWVGGAFGLIAILSRRHGGCNTRGLEWIPAFQEERRERFSSSPVKPVKYEGIFQHDEDTNGEIGRAAMSYRLPAPYDRPSLMALSFRFSASACKPGLPRVRGYPPAPSSTLPT